MAVSRLSIVKFLELALTISCVALHYKSMGEADEMTRLLVAGTFVGYTIILVGLFAGYLLGEPISKKIDLFFSLLGCAMFIASGVLILQEWESGFKTDRRKMAISKGALAVINGVLFFFDSVFTFRA
uniref:Secreted protein member of chemokine-like factor super family n=1 Tax=Ochlerotatus triseriatus TaxID=7162 RepID=C6ZQY5_OCHTR